MGESVLSVVAEAADVPLSRRPARRANRGPARHPEVRRSGHRGQQARGSSARRAGPLGRAGGDCRQLADHQPELGRDLLHRDARPFCPDRLGPAEGRQGGAFAARAFADLLRSGVDYPPYRHSQSAECRELADRHPVPVRDFHLFLCLPGDRHACLFVANGGRDGLLDRGGLGDRRRLGLAAARNPRRTGGTRAGRRRLRRQDVRHHQPRSDPHTGPIPGNHRVPDRRDDAGAGGAPLQRAFDQPRRHRTRARQSGALFFAQRRRAIVWK